MAKSRLIIHLVEHEAHDFACRRGYRGKPLRTHYLVDNIAAVPAILDSIKRQLAAGERP